MFYSMQYKTPIGDCLLVSDEENLVGLWFEGQKYYCSIKEPIKAGQQTEVLIQTKEWLDHYFLGKGHAYPISIIIPCHRVVGANGSLTGYAGGLQKKKWLLKHEGANV